MSQKSVELSDSVMQAMDAFADVLSRGDTDVVVMIAIDADGQASTVSNAWSELDCKTAIDALHGSIERMDAMIDELCGVGR